MAKKINKTYFGLPKTPIDDNTVFYASLDGTTVAEVGGAPTVAGVATYIPAITGLGAVITSMPTYKLNPLLDGLTIEFCGVISNGATYVLNFLDINDKLVVGIYKSSSSDTLFFSVRDTSNAEIANPSAGSNTYKKEVRYVRITVDFTSCRYSAYLDGKLSTWATLSQAVVNRLKELVKIQILYTNGTDKTLSCISDVSISNIDRGNVFPTLPKDFIDGKATIAPAFNSQRKVYSEALTSQYTVGIVKGDDNKRPKQQTVAQATPGTWASGDTIKVKGLGGEIISGVIDTDTALCKIVYADGTNIVTVDNVSKLAVNDQVIPYNANGTMGSTATITAIDTTNLKVTLSTTYASTYTNGLMYETTASSSVPVAKTNLTGTAQAGAGSTITLPGTFSAVDDAYNTYDIMITAGTGIGQRRTISDYVGSTKVATVSSAWATNPDATSVFTIYTVPIVGTWSALGTTEATLTLGTNALLTTQDIQIEYSTNMVAGQGKVPVYETVLGGEVNGRKLVPGTVAIRDDFGGKISGSVVENPHFYKINDTNSLPAPSTFVTERGQINLVTIGTLNGSNDSKATSTSGNMGQQLFSFNLIRLVEDKLGMPIPALDKVAWLKANINKANCTWYGYGSCPAGNKANFAVYHGSAWTIFGSNFTASPTSLIGYSDSTNAITNRIDASGFVHFLAYTDASDGVTASTIYTDYISLDVELKTPAGYDVLVPENPRRDDNWRVTSADVKETNDFGGKISGSVVENPHTSKHAYNVSLLSPSAFSTETSQLNYGNIGTLNNQVYNPNTITNTNIAQSLFSFNIIELIERKYGKIPVSNKLAWAKANINKITANWYGYGSCPSGNKASFVGYNNTTLAWTLSVMNNTALVPSVLTSNIFLVTDIAKLIDANGFAHFLAYTDASDGVTASTIYTDYINCEVELKPEAVRQLQYFASKSKKSNVLLVRKETKEVQAFFEASNEDKVAVVGKYAPPAPTAPTDSVTILAEIPEFLVTDLSSTVGDKQGTTHWKNLLYKLSVDRTELLGQFGFGRVQLPAELKGVNVGSKVAINATGFSSGYTSQNALSVFKKPLVGVIRYLVNHNGELKLLVIAKYASDGTVGTSSSNIGLLIPITGRPLVKDADGVLRATVAPTAWNTPDEEILGYVNDAGELIVTYQ